MRRDNVGESISDWIDRLFRTIEMIGISALLKATIPSGSVQGIIVGLALVATIAYPTVPIVYRLYSWHTRRKDSSDPLEWLAAFAVTMGVGMAAGLIIVCVLDLAEVLKVLIYPPIPMGLARG